MSKQIKISDLNHKALKIFSAETELEMGEIANGILEKELRKRMASKGLKYPEKDN